MKVQFGSIEGEEENEGPLITWAWENKHFVELSSKRAVFQKKQAGQTPLNT